MSATVEPAAGTSGSAWRTSPLFMLRVAGLPVEAVLPLQQLDTVHWAERVLAAERALDETGQSVGDALEELIGRNDAEQERRSLLDLRRDVFNRRLPKRLAEARALAGRLPDPTRDLLEDWLDRRVAYASLVHRGSAVLAAELKLGRAHLRRLVLAPRLRNGLLLSSPSLDRYVPTYLHAPGKRARRLERSVLEYVYRTAFNTSPFSSFTAVALGRFAPGSGASLLQADIDGPWRSHPRLNIAALARLATALAENPRSLPDLPLRLTSGQRSDHEVLQEIIDLLGDERELPFRVIAERLQAADPDHRDPEHIDLYLRHLLRLSLLTVPSARIDIHSGDPVAAFREGIARLDTPLARTLVGRVDHVAALVKRYSQADLDARRELLAGIRQHLDAAQAELGVAKPSTPRTLLYEDVSIPAANVVADEDSWKRSLEPSLQGVAKLLPVFDLMVAQRLSLKGFFLARFGSGGRCDDVLRFVHDFHRDYYDRYLKSTARRKSVDENGRYVREPNWLRVPEVDAINDAREELIRRMTAIHAESGTSVEIVLDDEFVEGVARMIPPRLLDFQPRSFFLQVADQGDWHLGVINRCYSGLTLMFSRFVHCFDETDGGGLAAELRRELARLTPRDAVFAEVTGGYDTTNLNPHPTVTPYELVCPGDLSFRPAAERLPIDNLSVVHDADADRLLLRSRSLGVEVIPVYLGFLAPLALPEVQRAMLLFSPTSMSRIDMWSGVDPPLRGGSIRYRPRVRYRDAVIDRRTWTIDPELLPHRRVSAGDAEWMLDWQRFRTEHRLPRRLFASREAAGWAGFTRKPQYVDFDSYFSLSLLESAVRKANRPVSLKEMLPDLADVWLRSAAGRHVTEQTIEMTGTPEQDRSS